MSDLASGPTTNPVSAERTDPGRPRVVLCAKSRWHPAIRREHAIASTAAAQGYEIDFIERAQDVRDLSWSGLTHRRRPFRPLTEGLLVIPQFTPVPGHRNELAQRLDAAGLRRLLRRAVETGPAPQAVVVNAPWNWAATSALPDGVRRVVDLTDDWTTLLPQRRERILRHHEQIADEADAIVVVAPGLADLFDREVVVVPNAVAPELLATPAVPAPGQRRMIYVGTLSERFDAGLMEQVLTLLPDWTLNLYGPCHYAGAGESPGAPLQSLLGRFGSRVTWHGMVSRSNMSRVLDDSDVAVLPNDPGISIGQDSMKLYDYAARARPIVATPIRVPDEGPAVLALAADPQAFADAVSRLDGADGANNRAWAESNGWAARLPLWMAAVTGAARESAPPFLPPAF